MATKEWTNLRFGIRSLDQLLGRPREEVEYGFHLLHEEETTSICIVGPDGTGKSVLALHLMSKYAESFAKTDLKRHPHLLYVSTDLNFSKAETMWKHFGLHEPTERVRVLRHEQTGTGNEDRSAGVHLNLRPCRPYSFENESRLHTRHHDPQNSNPSDSSSSVPGPLLDFLYTLKTNEATPTANEVAFVDLASHTAGDDWSYLTRLLATIEKPARAEPRHLMVIDAVEGLQMFGGERDAFGAVRSRRSRLAQLVRAAHQKCHLVFIVEEPKADERLPEQFLTDLVIRLRNVILHGYASRTIEVEKVRGQANVRGQHPCTIRNGHGSTTGLHINPDDPSYKLEDGSPLSYLLVLPSLDYLTRQMMQKRACEERLERAKLRCGFDIRYLDNMLMPGEGKEGLPGSTVTALIGPSKTHKSKLGIAFLSQCFAPCHEHIQAQLETYTQIVRGYEDAKKSVSEHVTALTSWCEGTAANYNSAREGNSNTLTDGVAVLISTEDATPAQLVNDIVTCLERHVKLEEQQRKTMTALIESRVICRRLEVHTVTSSLLLRVITAAVDEALLRMRGTSEDPQGEADRERCASIRVVIDNWTTIRETYPAVREDALFLPYLTYLLRRKGVTTLLIESRTGRGAQVLLYETDSAVPSLVDHTICTWHVSFNGRRLVAISPIPAFQSEERAVTRELRLDSGVAMVDPRLELYRGLQTGEPTPIPLRVRLFTESADADAYAEQVNTLLVDLFPYVRSLGGEVVSKTPVPFEKHGEERYDRLREICYLQTDALDHTVVIEVDEFWAIDQPKGLVKGLRDITPYLDQETETDDASLDQIADPYRLFRTTSEEERSPESRTTEENDVVRRRTFFDWDRLGYTSNDLERRIPYTWDFGFLICRYKAWLRARYRELSARYNPTRRIRVQDVWNALHYEVVKPREDGTDKRPEDKPDDPGYIRSWRAFLEACSIVAHANSERTSDLLPAFDLSLLTPESVSCLVLEVWMSEIYRTLTRRPDNKAIKRLLQITERTRPQQDPIGLVDLLGWPKEPCSRFADVFGKTNINTVEFRRERVEGYSLELFMTISLLFEVLEPLALTDPERVFAFRIRDADPRAVGARHWYKTASRSVPQFDDDDPVVPL